VVAGVRPVNTTMLEYVREVAYVVEMDEQALEVRELREVPYWTQLWSSFSYVFHPIDTAGVVRSRVAVGSRSYH
jgi:hypothetical protein